MFAKTRNELKALGLPSGDNFNMPTSSKKFPDGSNFKIEIPTVNSIELMSMILEESTKQGILIN